MKYLASISLLIFASFLSAQPCPDGPMPKVKPDGGPVIKSDDGKTFRTGYIAPTPQQRAAAYQRDKVRNGGRVAMAARNTAIPDKFDCTELGWVPPIEDQGSCGDCYGVATADQLTGTFIKEGYQKNDGSFAIRFQYGLDCERFGGCNGGWGWEVAEYMRDKGFPAEYYMNDKGSKITDYPPYVASPRTCRLPAGAKMWKPAEIGFCSGSSNKRASVAEIQVSVMQRGMVNIAFNANSAYSNAGPNSIVRVTGQANHETTLVGWDNSKNGGKGAWKSRGNWGKGLGDQGYVWMTYDSEFDDPFWMSATPLPPPPDPDPPTPPTNIPVITSSLSPSGFPGKPFAYQITATNSPTAFGSSVLPVGLTLDAKGLISGTPTVEAVTSVTVTATNEAGTGSAQLKITISNVPVPPIPTGADSIIITLDGKTRAFELFPPGSQAAMIQAREARIKSLQAEIDALKSLNSPQPPKEEPKPEPKKTTWNSGTFYDRGDDTWFEGVHYLAIASSLSSRPDDRVAGS